MKRFSPCLKTPFWAFLFFFSAQCLSTAFAAPTKFESARVVYGKGSQEELHVHFIAGQKNGPTVMILGGIHGNEPGGYLSSDLYANLQLKRGNLIVVPRANLHSIIHNQRGVKGDMNRKFGAVDKNDPEIKVIAVLKHLMAQSDYLITQHDANGFYRPTWHNKNANPQRFGQSIIADASEYVSQKNGQKFKLRAIAEKVIHEVNQEIEEKEYHFNFLDSNTANAHSNYKEFRNSATYYALTELDIPAFCIETSHDLPSMEMKVRQHNLFINSFLKQFGVEIEAPSFTALAPVFYYALIKIDNAPPVAIFNGQTLHVKENSLLEIVDINSNVEAGMSTQFESLKTPNAIIDSATNFQLNALYKPLKVKENAQLKIRKDNAIIGQIHIALHSENAPKISGNAAKKLDKNKSIELAWLPTEIKLAQVNVPIKEGVEKESAKPIKNNEQAKTFFKLEINGAPQIFKPDEEIAINEGSIIKLLDYAVLGEKPLDSVMNLVGFVPPSSKNKAHNNGNDLGFLINSAKDLQSAYSLHKQGEIYALKIEQGKKTLAQTHLKIIKTNKELSNKTKESKQIPARLIKGKTMTLSFNNQLKTLPFGARVTLANNALVKIQAIDFNQEIDKSRLRMTFGGREISNSLPTQFFMRAIPINLAVFVDNALIGKITFVPEK